ncbi:methyltransferase domain-containing protein [Flavobacterium sp.]|jgi:SAM-dependent methyltransferase|uniref:class I SAM-dependent methyltransferase n=1 Tax=Flavobacterium sp. TaxID=239 RepID=UPI0022BBBBA0|nr:methyltransferase domain-containing protein [Flavobacterium sp.]MCZ8143911.1 methyltransferase domain-containing protein [Flavobacterium sp.]MCZ8367289.1 methyltransferase domain-containing protein [Flavobacterium sp.]
MLDLFGQAILDFYTQNNPQPLLTETSISEKDEMDVGYLFRTYQNMPRLEQKALQLTNGKVLDIGAGAGCHTLYLQQKGIDVTALDQSSYAIQACRLQNIQHCVQSSLLDYNPDTLFDTILVLMNGTGIFGKLNQTALYLQKLKSLLNPGGQILIDSSDLIYMFDEDEDGGRWIPDNGYYGELEFTLHYKGQKEQFPWLYLDYNTLQNAALANGFQCELVMEGKNYDYLARLTV